jgi:hypothetical protein
MADRDDIQRAIEWTNARLICADFPIGLTQQFDSLFVRVETPPNAFGESWQTLEKTKAYNGRRVGKLAPRLNPLSTG